MDFGACSGDRDLVSQVGWDEEKPTFFINFIDDPKKPGRLNCYNSQYLHQWVNMPENTFAEWIPHDKKKGMDAEGYGGGPNLKKKYNKLYTGEFIILNNHTAFTFNNLQLGRPIMINAIYIGMVRLGNLGGTMGIGDVHGQTPGYRIYEFQKNSSRGIDIINTPVPFDINQMGLSRWTNEIPSYITIEQLLKLKDEFKWDLYSSYLGSISAVPALYLLMNPKNGLFLDINGLRPLYNILGDWTNNTSGDNPNREYMTIKPTGEQLDLDDDAYEDLKPDSDYDSTGDGMYQYIYKKLKQAGY